MADVPLAGGVTPTENPQIRLCFSSRCCCCSSDCRCETVMRRGYAALDAPLSRIAISMVHQQPPTPTFPSLLPDGPLLTLARSTSPRQSSHLNPHASITPHLDNSNQTSFCCKPTAPNPTTTQRHPSQLHPYCFAFSAPPLPPHCHHWPCSAQTRPSSPQSPPCLPCPLLVLRQSVPRQHASQPPQRLWQHSPQWVRSAGWPGDCSC